MRIRLLLFKGVSKNYFRAGNSGMIREMVLDNCPDGRSPAHLVAVLLVAVLCVAGALTGCAHNYPGGVVATEAQAIAIAEHECHSSRQYYSGPWHVRLQGEEWFLYLTPTGGMQITINARTGATDGCVVVTR